MADIVKTLQTVDGFHVAYDGQEYVVRYSGMMGTTGQAHVWRKESDGSLNYDIDVPPSLVDYIMDPAPEGWYQID